MRRQVRCPRERNVEEVSDDAVSALAVGVAVWLAEARPKWQWRQCGRGLAWKAFFAWYSVSCVVTGLYNKTCVLPAAKIGRITVETILPNGYTWLVTKALHSALPIRNFEAKKM
jgi:hypothetical protein